METYDAIVGFVSSVGFPIFVAIFMLTKNSRETADLKNVITDLTTAVKLLGGNQK